MKTRALTAILQFIYTVTLLQVFKIYYRFLKVYFFQYICPFSKHNCILCQSLELYKMSALKEGIFQQIKTIKKIFVIDKNFDF